MYSLNTVGLVFWGAICLAAGLIGGAKIAGVAIIATLILNIFLLNSRD